jgi:hypothetical protein
MGITADEIDRQIGETLDDMDANVEILERRAAPAARRNARIVMIGAVALVMAGVGYLVYRRVRRVSPAKRLSNTVFASLRDLRHDVSSGLKKPLPSVKVVIDGKEAKIPEALESIRHRVAPAVVGAAVTAVLQQVNRLSGSKTHPHVAGV